MLFGFAPGNAVKFSRGRSVNVVVGVRPLGTTAKQLLGPQSEDADADATDDAPSSFTLAETAAMTAQYLSGQDSGSDNSHGLRRINRGESSGGRREAKAVLRAVWRQQDLRGRPSTTPTPEPQYDPSSDALAMVVRQLTHRPVVVSRC